MKIVSVEIIRDKRKVTLPEEWRAAWREPDGEAIKSWGFSYFKVSTDEGIVGFGPYTGNPGEHVMSFLKGFDPYRVGEFWDAFMSGKRAGTANVNASGLEIALWDIIGKASGKPVYKLLGACRNRIMAYAATSRLLEIKEHIRQIHELMDMGFKAVKLRLHRPKPEDDLRMVKEVRDAVGDDLLILVDANQNNPSRQYNFWSRRTALKMARELDKLDVFFLEEPLPRRDVEGLAEIASSVDMFIAGGEHSRCIYDFRDHIVKGAYDIVQPDVILGAIGIIGMKKVGVIADYFGRLLIPHVCGASNLALSLAATLQAVATIENCPMVEYPFDPPILTVETQQPIVKEPILVDRDGFIEIPDKPGIGIEIKDYDDLKN